MNLIFDTETTGLPDRDWSWERDYMKFPYVVSISWKLGTKVHDYIINQEGRDIPKEVSAIHGITTKMANDPKKTQPACFVFQRFIDDASVAAKIVGHNIYFDTSMVKANILRTFGPKSKIVAQMDKALDKDKRADTMRMGHKLIGGKWPKLIELHEWLFGEPFDKAHTSCADVLACERCWIELKRRGVAI